jgi:PIN like domain
MKQSFPGYYPLTPEQFAALWKDCVFALDASFLLSLYRYSPKTTKNLLSTLNGLRTRLWLPYQAGLEFHRNRLQVISSHEHAYGPLINRIRKEKNQIIEILQPLNRHPYIDEGKHIESISRAIENIVTEIEENRDSHPRIAENDNVLRRLTEILDKRVGPPFSEQEIEQIKREGEKRFKNMIPPGFADEKKEANNKFGDLIIWKEIVKKAASEKRGIIFVTDDRKEDWWWRPAGKTVGPNPELIEEIQRLANVDFYMYMPMRFLEEAEKYENLQLKESTKKELRDMQAHVNPFLEAPYIDARALEHLAAGLRITNEELRRSLEGITASPKMIELSEVIRKQAEQLASNATLMEAVEKAQSSFRTPLLDQILGRAPASWRSLPTDVDRAGREIGSENSGSKEAKGEESGTKNNRDEGEK